MELYHAYSSFQSYIQHKCNAVISGVYHILSTLISPFWLEEDRYVPYGFSENVLSLHHFQFNPYVKIIITSKTCIQVHDVHVLE